jgi:hypothetical protein
MPIQNEALERETPGPLDTKTHRGASGNENSFPLFVKQARRALIRESLADDLYRIAMFAETGLIAIDGEDDHTLIRMADQLFKVALSAAANIGDLLAALEGGSS